MGGGQFGLKLVKGGLGLTAYRLMRWPRRTVGLPGPEVKVLGKATGTRRIGSSPEGAIRPKRLHSMAMHSHAWHCHAWHGWARGGRLPACPGRGRLWSPPETIERADSTFVSHRPDPLVCPDDLEPIRPHPKLLIRPASRSFSIQLRPSYIPGYIPASIQAPIQSRRKATGVRWGIRRSGLRSRESCCGEGVWAIPLYHYHSHANPMGAFSRGRARSSVLGIGPQVPGTGQ